MDFLFFSCFRLERKSQLGYSLSLGFCWKLLILSVSDGISKYCILCSCVRGSKWGHLAAAHSSTAAQCQISRKLLFDVRCCRPETNTHEKATSGLGLHTLVKCHSVICWSIRASSHLIIWLNGGQIILCSDGKGGITGNESHFQDLIIARQDLYGYIKLMFLLLLT